MINLSILLQCNEILILSSGLHDNKMKVIESGTFANLPNLEIL